MTRRPPIISSTVKSPRRRSTAMTPFTRWTRGRGGVRVYEEDGTFQRSIGTRGQGPGEFQGASSLHVDAQGRLLVADPGQARITAFSRSGEVLDTYSLPGIRRVTDMAPLPRGRYALAGAGKGLVHVFAEESDAELDLTVERFTTEGDRRGATVVDTASTLTLTPLAMDADGNLYLSDTRDVPQLRRLSWETKE